MSEPTSSDDARRARAEAEKALARQRGLWPRILQRVRALQELREENHFSERLAEAFRSDNDD
jgi:hypothetical protein